MHSETRPAGKNKIFSTLKKSHKRQSTVKQRCDLSEIQGLQTKLCQINTYFAFWCLEVVYLKL